VVFRAKVPDPPNPVAKVLVTPPTNDAVPVPVDAFRVCASKFHCVTNAAFAATVKAAATAGAIIVFMGRSSGVRDSADHAKATVAMADSEQAGALRP
jgi:hypothetical protein